MIKSGDQTYATSCYHRIARVKALSGHSAVSCADYAEIPTAFKTAA